MRAGKESPVNIDIKYFTEFVTWKEAICFAFLTVAASTTGNYFR